MTETERKDYCKNCDRSIYSHSDLAKTCDCNVADNGYYNLADSKCFCKIVDGKRAEKYPWENKDGNN